MFILSPYNPTHPSLTSHPITDPHSNFTVDIEGTLVNDAGIGESFCKNSQFIERINIGGRTVPIQTEKLYLLFLQHGGGGPIEVIVNSRQ